MESFIQGFNLEKSDNGTMYITTYLVRHGNARQVFGAYRLAHYLSFTTVLVKKETFSMFYWLGEGCIYIRLSS
jgi:hypothetical protein